MVELRKRSGEYILPVFGVLSTDYTQKDITYVETRFFTKIDVTRHLFAILSDFNLYLEKAPKLFGQITRYQYNVRNENQSEGCLTEKSTLLYNDFVRELEETTFIL